MRDTDSLEVREPEILCPKENGHLMNTDQPLILPQMIFALLPRSIPKLGSEEDSGVGCVKEFGIRGFSGNLSFPSIASAYRY